MLRGQVIGKTELNCWYSCISGCCQLISCVVLLLERVCCSLDCYIYYSNHARLLDLGEGWCSSQHHPLG